MHYTYFLHLNCFCYFLCCLNAISIDCIEYDFHWNSKLFVYPIEPWKHFKQEKNLCRNLLKKEDLQRLTSAVCMKRRLMAYAQIVTHRIHCFEKNVNKGTCGYRVRAARSSSWSLFMLLIMKRAYLDYSVTLPCKDKHFYAYEKSYP